MEKLLKKFHSQNSKTSLFKVSRPVFVGDKPDDAAAASEEPEEKGVEGKPSAKSQKAPEDEELSDEGKKIKQRQAVEKAVLEAKKKAEHLGINGAEYFDMEKFPGLEEKGYKSKIVVSMPENPEKFKDKPPRVVFYFHGKNGNAGGSYEQIKQQVEDMRNEGENVILVAPQDDGKNQWNEFDKGDAFKDMQKMVEQVAGGKPIRDISIASFSGGYYGVNKVLKNLWERAETDPEAKDLYGRIKHLGFLDSTYGGESTEEFAKWAAADKNNYLAVTNTRGTESEKGKDELVKALADHGVKEDRYSVETLSGGHENAPKDFGRLMSREGKNIPQEKVGKEHEKGKEESPAIPERSKDAMGGKEVMEKLKSLSMEERAGFIRQQFEEGNIPDFLRNFSEITVEANGHSAKIKVMPDYLALGDNADFTRIPMDPITAQYIADKYGCTLPTSKIVDDIEANATKLTFIGGPTIAEHVIDPQTRMPCSAKWNPQQYGSYEGYWMMTPDFAQMQNDLIEKNSVPRTLVAGHKKDVVYTPGLTQKRGVGIYLRGIQPEAVPHEETYADYSHGIRLVQGKVSIDGQEMDLAEALKNPEYAPMFNKGGVMDITSMYRGNLAKAVDASKVARTPLSLRESPGRATEETSRLQHVPPPLPEVGYAPTPTISNISYAPSAGPTGTPVLRSTPAGAPLIAQMNAPSYTPSEGRESPPTVPYTSLGDSFIVGIDKFNRGKFVRLGYHDRLNQPVRSGAESNPEMVGQQTSYMVTHLKTEVLPALKSTGIKTIVMGGGGNDMLGPLGSEEALEKTYRNTTQNLAEMYRTARQAGLNVVAITMPQWNRYIDKNYPDPAENQRHYKLWERINNFIMSLEGSSDGPNKVVRSDVLLMDPSNPQFLNQQFADSTDILHPAPAGSKIVHDEVEKAVNLVSRPENPQTATQS